jgi:hypothetical protein
MSLVLQSSGGGQITIQEPNTASNFTQDLPAVDGTILTSASQSIPSAALPTGSVLQVVQGSTSTAMSSSTNTLVDTGLTATITPKFATSKILVLVSQNGVAKATNNTYALLRLLRNGSIVQVFESQLCFTNSNTTNSASSSTNYLDSPATTSATTYKTQISSGSNNAIVEAQASSSASTITLMEIAA